MVTAVRGTLIEVDPPIKAIIVKIDSEENHAFIIEDLGEGTLFVKESTLPRLKQLLEQRLKETQAPTAEESESE